MPHAYTEDQLVEQPRTLSELFAELGWQTVSAVQNLRRTRDLLPRKHSGLLGQVNLKMN